MASVTRFLIRQLKLVVNEHKSRVVKTNDCVFLGFTFRGTKLRWSDRAYQDFRHRIRELTGRSGCAPSMAHNLRARGARPISLPAKWWGVSMGYRLRKLA